MKQLVDRLRHGAQRAIQDYRQWHVDDRCRPDGCDCPCGYCHHDQRHLPGRNSSTVSTAAPSGEAYRRGFRDARRMIRHGEIDPDGCLSGIEVPPDLNAAPSAEAVDRAARAARATRAAPFTAADWRALPVEARDYWRDVARAVIAALGEERA